MPLPRNGQRCKRSTLYVCPLMVGFCAGGGTPLYTASETDVDVAWCLPQSEYRPPSTCSGGSASGLTQHSGSRRQRPSSATKAAFDPACPRRHSGPTACSHGCSATNTSRSDSAVRTRSVQRASSPRGAVAKRACAQSGTGPNLSSSSLANVCRWPSSSPRSSPSCRPSPSKCNSTGS